MATINDIAARLGVSKSTVSKGLNNATDISEEMRKKILETAVELGYNNRRMMNREKKLCVIIENMDYTTPNQFGYDIILGFRQMAEAEGWTVDVIPVDKDFQREMPYSVYMLQNNYIGSFVLGFSLIDPWMSDFQSCKIPTVLYDNCVSGNPKIASVGCDSQEGFEEAVRYLVGLGHQRIGLLSGPLESYIIKARYNAYLNALSKYNLEINEAYTGQGYYIADSARDHVMRMYELGVTAILCSHDVRAISALTECANKGIRIPEDMSIIGFDDLSISPFSDPPLTTIRQDRLALGKTGYYAMSCLLADLPISSVMLRAPLIIRGSSGPAAKRF